jgi:hypothetical protein
LIEDFKKGRGIKIMGALRTFDETYLRNLLKVGEKKSYSGYCHPNEIKRLEKEGFEVENFDFGYEEIEVKRLR